MFSYASQEFLLPPLAFANIQQMWPCKEEMKRKTNIGGTETFFRRKSSVFWGDNFLMHFWPSETLLGKWKVLCAAIFYRYFYVCFVLPLEWKYNYWDTEFDFIWSSFINSSTITLIYYLKIFTSVLRYYLKNKISRKKNQ